VRRFSRCWTDAHPARQGGLAARYSRNLRLRPWKLRVPAGNPLLHSPLPSVHSAVARVPGRRDRHGHARGVRPASMAKVNAGQRSTPSSGDCLRSTPQKHVPSPRPFDAFAFVVSHAADDDPSSTTCWRTFDASAPRSIPGFDPLVLYR
jgi:hypothetical protein